MAESYLDMIFRTKKEGSGNKQVIDDLADVKARGKSAGEAFEMLTGSSLSAAGAFAAVTGALKFSIGAAMEAEKIQADLNATLTSTKGAAGLSADEINRMASSLSEMSGIEDDSIVKAQAMLLTFTNIGRDVFPMASEAMVNMASKFGSVDAAAMQLGKALNDPIAGVGALRKVGVALSDTQEKQIKDFMAMNNIAEAQKIILGELSVEFGGLAEAMGSTTEGKINRLKNSLGNLAETIGEKFLPVIGDATDALNLFMSGNDKITGTIKKHESEVRVTSKTYAEYYDEIDRVMKLTGMHVSKTGELTRATIGANGAIVETEIGVRRLSMAEWEEVQASQAMKTALDDSRQAAIDAGGGLDEFSSKVGASSLVTTDFGKILKDLEKDKLARLNAEMQNYTTQLLFNQAAQGLDSESSRKLAEAMGLITPVTSAALSELDKLVEAKKAGRITTDEFTAAVKRLDQAITGLHDKDVNINVYTNNVNNSGTGGYVDPGTGSGYGGTKTPIKYYPGEPEDALSESPMGRQGGNTINLGGVTINNAMDLNVLVARLARMTR